jgi:DNA-binding protein YbaB
MSISPQDELRSQLEEISAQYAEIREKALERSTVMAAINETVTDSKGTLSVSVGAGGNVTALKFLSKRYREMAPAELADLILSTMKTAQERVRKQLVDKMPSSTVGGLPIADLLAGKVDIAQLLPADLAERFAGGTSGAGFGDLSASVLGAKEERFNG